MSEGNELMNGKILITNIQRFSLHDGPGIRTTVFLKGCSLRCPWCSNPENLEYREQRYVKDDQPGTYGRWYGPDELIDEILKDKAFYNGKLPQPEWNIKTADQVRLLPGGVTFSGGEPLLQVDALLPVFKELKKQSVHTAIETCLFVPKKNVIDAIKYVDLFYVDIKILDREIVKSSLGGNLDCYLHHLTMVLKSTKPVIIRVPVIGGYTDISSNRREIKELIVRYIGQGFKPIKIELIQEHHLGISKYESLGYPIPKYKGVSGQQMDEYKKELDELGVEVEICRI